MIATSSTSTSSSGITAPMNINAVIAHLVEMTPPQRKQFAQMHMDDPMMLSAAKFVDNQITKQAAAMSAQRMGAAPPPVNQQVVAQMSPQPPAPQAAPMPQAGPQPEPQAAPQDQGQAQPMPEDTGIAQLPAPNMEGMADGGIVGYADTGLVQDRQPGESFAAYRQRVLEGGKLPSKIAAADNAPFPYTIGTGPFTGSRDELIRQANAELERRRGANQMPTKSPYVTDTVDLSQTPPAAAKPPAKPVAPAARKDDKVKRNPDNYKPAEAAPKKKVGIDQLRQETIPATQAIPPSAAETPSQDLSLDRFMPAGSKRPSEADVEAANAAKMQGAEEALSGFNADLAKRGKAMTEQEARIAVREATSKDRLETDTNLSLINAGLAMMQSTGKGLAGIAEGAQVGTKQYQAGLREYDNAKEKLDTARDLIEQYRRTEDTMNDKDRRALTKNINDTRAAGLESLISFRTKIYGEDRADARSLLDVTVKQQEAAADRTLRKDLQASSEAGANTRAAISERNAAARAQMLTGADRTAQLIASGTPQGEQVKKGLQQIADIQAGKFNLQTQYAGYVSDWAKAGGAINGPKMSMAEYAAQFQGPKLVDLPAKNVKP